MIAKPTITVRWIDAGREPRCAPDPAFPNGMDADLTRGKRPACDVKLPYPARRCGQFLIKCDACGFTAVITTAGRPDDPRSAKLPCHARPARGN